jgi:hypothetical protein
MIRKMVPWLCVLVLFGSLFTMCKGCKDKKKTREIVNHSIKRNHPHNIKGVWSFRDVFDDENTVQLQMAKYKGIKLIANRAEAERMKGKLCLLLENKYWGIDRLKNSIPYLVPSAKQSLDSVGITFMDSLHAKGLNTYRVVVTSVLRTEEDIHNLRKRNRNAISNSAHSYGTTYDVSWKHFRLVGDPDHRPIEMVSQDTLKLVLSEALRDLRKRRVVYVKYERMQGCFHVTSRL